MSTKMSTRGSKKDKLSNLNQQALEKGKDLTQLSPTTEVALLCSGSPLSAHTTPGFIPGQTSGTQESITKVDLEQVVSSLETRLNSSLDRKLDRLAEHLQKVSSTLVDNAKQIKSILDTVTDHTEAISWSDGKIVALEKSNEAKNVLIDNLTQRLDRLESDKRKYNIIVRGVDEQKHPNPYTAINGLFVDLGLSIDCDDCDFIYRMGSRVPVNQRPRPIMVKFLRLRDKSDIYKKVRNIAGLPAWKGVSISDDMTPQETNNQRDMRAVVAHARATGRNAKLKGKGVEIDAKRYTYSQLDQLPSNLTLESAKTVKVASGIAFQSHHSFLSSLYPAKFRYKNINYESAEQGFCHQASVVSNRPELAAQILATCDPYTVKRLAKPVQTNDRWTTVKLKTLEEITHAKFSQNDLLTRKLIATGNSKLYLAITDTEFGVGQTLAERDKIGEQSPGQNIYGQLLAKVREDLRLTN